jgi:hypothetical protein
VQNFLLFCLRRSARSLPACCLPACCCRCDPSYPPFFLFHFLVVFCFLFSFLFCLSLPPRCPHLLVLLTLSWSQRELRAAALILRQPKKKAGKRDYWLRNPDLPFFFFFVLPVLLFLLFVLRSASGQIRALEDEEETRGKGVIPSLPCSRTSSSCEKIALLSV